MINSRQKVYSHQGRTRTYTHLSATCLAYVMTLSINKVWISAVSDYSAIVAFLAVEKATSVAQVQPMLLPAYLHSVNLIWTCF